MKVPLIGGTPVNLTMVVTIIYAICYVLMDPIAGSLAAAMVLVLHKQTAALVAANAPVYGFSLIQAVAIFHFVMWIAQVGENIDR